MCGRDTRKNECNYKIVVAKRQSDLFGKNRLAFLYFQNSCHNPKDFRQFLRGCNLAIPDRNGYNKRNYIGIDILINPMI